MLDELGREDCAQLAVGLTTEIFECVGLDDVVTTSAGPPDHVAVEVDPERLDPGVAEEVEHLPPPAAKVEDRGGVTEEVDVRPLHLADELLRASEQVLE